MNINIKICRVFIRIKPHIEGLIWTNKTQNKDFIVLNNQLLDIDNKQFISNLEDEICLWHPVVNNEDNISQWQSYLWVNKIVQVKGKSWKIILSQFLLPFLSFFRS